MKTLFALAITLLITVPTFAMNRDTASASKRCVYEDVDGKYEASGESLNIARSEVTDQCFQAKLDTYARYNNGNLPDDDQAALMLDTCVNVCKN